MELPDYETILFINYGNRPERFSSSLNLAKKQLKKIYSITDDFFISDCLSEIEIKSNEIEKRRNSLISSCKTDIEKWKNLEVKSEGTYKAICLWEGNILKYEKDSHAFDFEVYSDCKTEVIKKYSLSKNDIKEIEKAVKSMVGHFEKEEENCDDQNKDLLNRVFKSNYFELFELLFNEFNIDESKRADLKFIFEMMKEDSFLQPEVSQKEFYDCISRVFNMDLQITSNWSKTKHRIKIYSIVKENFKKK